jgi:hypothetical protein
LAATLVLGACVVLTVQQLQFWQDSRTLFEHALAVTPDNYVAIVDLKSLEVSGHIDIGGPDGLAWAVRTY